MPRPIDIVRKLAPRAREVYLEAFEISDWQFLKAEITTPARLAHFLAQAFEETGAFTVLHENMSYSAKRMCEVWPSRFKSIEAAKPYAHNPEKLANRVYANRMGNGPAETGHGFRYRGRGVLQTTGREAYAKYGKRLRIPLEEDPDLLLTAQYALAPALLEWDAGNCNDMADAENLRAITKKINGGYTNLSKRQNWHKRIRPLVTSVELKGEDPEPSDEVPQA